MAADQGRRAGARSRGDRRHRRPLPLSRLTSGSTDNPAELAEARAGDRALRRLARQLGRQHKVPGYAIVTLSLKPKAGRPATPPPSRWTRSPISPTATLRRDPGRHEQNLVLPHVAQRDLPALWRALDAIGVATPNVGLVTDIIACPGLDYCSLANARSIPMAQELTRRFADLDLARDRASSTSRFPAASTPAATTTSATSASSASRRTARSTTRSRSAAAPTRMPRSARCSARRCLTARSPTWSRRSSPPISSCASGPTSSSSTPSSASASSRSRSASMRSLRTGAVVEDRFVRLLDDAPVPDRRRYRDGGAVARRRASCCARRADRRALAEQPQSAELGAHLDRLALVALVFPKFRDGRAYSQARVLRERYGFAASCAPPARCCAISSCSCCAPASMPSRFKETTRSLSPPPSATTRCGTSRPATAVSPRCTGGCSCVIRRVPASEYCSASGFIGTGGAADAAAGEELDRALRNASRQVIATALRTVGRDRLALVSSFGIRSAALLLKGDGRCRSRDTRDLSRHRMAVRGNLGLSRALIATLGLHDVRSIKPLEGVDAQARIRNANCGLRDPDACCRIRKWNRWCARWRRSRHGSTGASFPGRTARRDPGRRGRRHPG